MNKSIETANDKQKATWKIKKREGAFARVGIYDTMQEKEKKNMKRIVKISLIIGLLLAGWACKPKKIDNTELLTEVQAVMSKLDNYTMGMEMEMKMKMMGLDIDMDMEMLMDLFEKPLKAKGEMKINIKMLGQNEAQTMLMYMEEKDGELITYAFDGNQWTKQISPVTTNANGSYASDYSQLLTMFKESPVTEVEYKGQPAYKLEGKITGEMMRKAAEQSNNPMTGGMMDLLKEAKSEIVTIIHIDKNTKQLLSMSMDVSEMVKEVMEQGYQTKLDEFSALMTIDFSNFAKVADFEIPEEARIASITE